jgi:hypothetical protein
MKETMIDRPPFKFSALREYSTGASVFTFTLRMEDNLMLSDLDAFEFGLLKECDKSEAIADKLLALECIVRKIERKLGVEQP